MCTGYGSQVVVHGIVAMYGMGWDVEYCEVFFIPSFCPVPSHYGILFQFTLDCIARYLLPFSRKKMSNRKISSHPIPLHHPISRFLSYALRLYPFTIIRIISN